MSIHRSKEHRLFLISLLSRNGLKSPCHHWTTEQDSAKGEDNDIKEKSLSMDTCHEIQTKQKTYIGLSVAAQEDQPPLPHRKKKKLGGKGRMSNNPPSKK